MRRGLGTARQANSHGRSSRVCASRPRTTSGAALPVRVDAGLDLPGWDAVGEPGLSLLHQVRAASPSHLAAAGGRLVLHPPANGYSLTDVEEALGLAGRSGICRLCFAGELNQVQTEHELANGRNW